MSANVKHWGPSEDPRQGSWGSHFFYFSLKKTLGKMIIFHSHNEELICIIQASIDTANGLCKLPKDSLKTQRTSLAKGLGHVKGTLNGVRGRDRWYLEVQLEQICN